MLPIRDELTNPRSMSANSLSNLTFLFDIMPVVIKPDIPENRKFNGYWYPPESKDDYTIDQRNQTGWCRWTNANANGPISITQSPDPATSPADSNGEDGEGVCSVFFDSECNYFLVTPTDCMQTGSTNRLWDIGWTRLGFENLSQPQPQSPLSQGREAPARLSKLTFLAEHHTLAGYGAPTWMPQLLPETYDNHETPQAPTGLVGELCLLVALAGFTTPPIREEFLTMMHRHFCPPFWVPRPGSKPITSTLIPLFPFALYPKCCERKRLTRIYLEHLPYCHRQGLVVRIRPVPGSSSRSIDLQAVENGQFGPLFQGVD